MSDHNSSLMPYVFVLLALLGLTALTVGAAYVDLGSEILNFIGALAIATVKASIVVLFFMHVKEGTALIKLTAAGGFFWLAIFLVFIFADIMTRTNVVTGW